MFINVVLQERASKANELPALSRYLLALLISAMAGALLFSVVYSTKAKPDLAYYAMANLKASGVENPITAVLLNFRSYDTLLEIAVLMIVAVTMLPAAPNTQTNQLRFVEINSHQVVHPVLIGLLRWLIPLAIILSGYLLWTGAYDPGGAFQAAAVLAGAGVALSLAGRHQFNWQAKRVRLLLCLGLIVFIGVATASAFFTGTVLDYPEQFSSILILMIEFAATLSIAAILLLLFCRLNGAANSHYGASQ